MSEHYQEEQAGTKAAHAPAPEEGTAQGPGFRMIPPHRPVDDSFADGAAGFVIGRNVMKLDLYRVQGYDRETGQEVRAQSHRIVLPLTAIGELRQLLHQLDQTLQRGA